MKQRSPVRLTLLVEDRRHERFTRMVCKQLGFDPRKMIVAPYLVGRGSAKQRVTQTIPVFVRQHRSRSGHQKDIALLVVTDADELEVAARRNQLDDALNAAGITPRAADERIVLWIPKWHIETWLKHFAGEVVVEAEPYSYKASPQKERDGADGFFREYQPWKTDPQKLATLPSLKEAYKESERLDF